MTFVKKRPFPILPLLLVGLISGILLEYYFRVESPIYLIISLLIGVAVLLYGNIHNGVNRKRFFIVGVFLLFSGIGTQIGSKGSDLNADNYFMEFSNENSTYQFRIDNPVSQTEKTVKCTGSVEYCDDKSTVGRVIVYFPKSPKSLSLQYGDVVLLKSEFKEVQTAGNPHEFDYKSYLAHQNIYHQTYMWNDSWEVAGNTANPVLKSLFELRLWLSNELTNSGLSPENNEVAQALLLGNRGFIGDEIQDSYASAGATHILAVSGLHVGILMLILNFLFKPIHVLHKHGKMVATVLTISCLWVYAVLSGLSPSVLRSATMFSFVVIGMHLQRETSIYQSILVSAFFLIVFDPHVIFSVGFQLSYSAVLGIVTLQPGIYKSLFSRWYLVDKVWEITSVSIAAQIATLPLVLYYFQQFPNYFWLTNLIVIPAAFAILLVGVLYFFLIWLPYISDLLLFILDGILSVMTYLIELIQQLPFSVSRGFSISLFDLFVLYPVIVALVLGITVKKRILLLSGIFTVVFGVSQYKHLVSEGKKSQLVFYNAGKNDLIDLFDHGKITEFAAISSDTEANARRYVCEGNRVYMSSTTAATDVYQISELTGPVQIENESLLFINQEILDSSKQLPLASLVYLYDITFIPRQMLDAWIKNESQIVLGSNIKYSTKKYLLRQNDLLIQDLKEGAFLLDLD